MRAWTREHAGSVALLTLTRPPINALDQAALDALAGAVREIETDPDVRVLVVTGGLDGLFCTGGDLKYWRRIRHGHAVARAGHEVFGRLARLPIPVVAAIDGHVIGDGLALALACDLRVASDRARFRLPETAHGFIPGWGLIRELVAVVGQARAADLLLTGRPIDAAGAQAIGLVRRPLGEERVGSPAFGRFPGGRAVARPGARGGLGRGAAGGEVRAAWGDERRCFESVWGGTDWREGIDALLAKRPPAFGRRGGDASDLAARVRTGRPADRGSRCC